jgi:pimeloyl-ACP methyl ester carboxylesterase
VPFADINGLKIYYEIHGDGDAIVLLHHGFGCTKMWKDIYPAFVSKGYRIVMYDRRGYGQSEKGPDFPAFYESDRFRPESVAELDLLRDVFDLDAFHIVGQCEGGVVGIDYAVQYPHHVKTITVSSTQCYSTMSMAEFNALKMPNPFRDLEPEIKEKLIQWHGNDHAESFYNQFRTCGGAYGTGVFDLRTVLPSVSCPALVLYPDRSFLFDVEQADALYRNLPHGELAILPHCGHNTYEEQPDNYTRIILDFLKRHNFEKQ